MALRIALQKGELFELARLMRLHQPVGVYLLLAPTLWALFIASRGLPELWLIALFTLGALITRSAGCVINDLWDQNYDSGVKRTRQRPLASGRLRRESAWMALAVLLVLAVLLLIPLPPLAAWLALPGALMAAVYPSFKRWFPLPQLFLSLVFAWGVPMAYAGVLGEVPPSGWFLYLANGLWIFHYDTQYAMADRPDDIRLGLKSSAITLGRLDLLVLIVTALAALLALALLAGPNGLGLPYMIALVLSALVFFRGIYMCRERKPDKCFRAFRENHWIGWIVLLGIWLSLASP